MCGCGCEAASTSLRKDSRNVNRTNAEGCPLTSSTLICCASHPAGGAASASKISQSRKASLGQFAQLHNSFLRVAEPWRSLYLLEKAWLSRLPREESLPKATDCLLTGRHSAGRDLATQIHPQLVIWPCSLGALPCERNNITSDLLP